MIRCGARDVSAKRLRAISPARTTAVEGGRMMPSSFRTVSVSRRRVLSLAARATALAAASPLRRATAQVTPVESPAPVAASAPPLPSTLAADALATIPRRGRGARRRDAGASGPRRRDRPPRRGPRGARHGRPRQPLVDAAGHPGDAFSDRLPLQDLHRHRHLASHRRGRAGPGQASADVDPRPDPHGRGGRGQAPIGFRIFPRSSRSAPSSPTTTRASPSSDD
jgi:hypothetical protein